MTPTARRGTLSLAPVLAGLLLVLAALPAQAQSVSAMGAGPRFSFVRGTAEPGAESTRFSGGFLRLQGSGKTAIELSIDYGSHLNETLNERIKDYPIQGSLLMYLMRSSFSPYVLAGVGWYSQRVDYLDENAEVESATTRRFGYHAGVGGEVRLGQRAAVHVDYRYTFIRFGTPPEGTTTAPGAIPVPGLLSLQERLKLSHEGSMWTTGVTFFF